MSELVSVIVPAYNAAATVGETLDSILGQAAPDLRLDVIVVDDGSTDDTEGVVRRFADRVRYFRIPHSGRPGVVRNHGLRQMAGEYAAFLDDDDLWLPGSLDQRLRLLFSRPGAGFVYANHFVLDGTQLTLNFTSEHPPDGWIFDDLFARNFIHTSTVVVRRDIVEEAGGFHPEVFGPEDYWAWLRFARLSASAYLAEPVSIYRLRPGSVSTTSLSNKLPDLIRVVRTIAREFDLPRDQVNERVNPLRLWLAKALFRERRYLAAMRQLLQVVRSEPALTLEAGLSWLRRHNSRGAA